MQKVDYRYNSAGFLIAINDCLEDNASQYTTFDCISSADSPINPSESSRCTNDLYKLNFLFDTKNAIGATQNIDINLLKDGNISAINLELKGVNKDFLYTYEYDYLKRFSRNNHYSKDVGSNTYDLVDIYTESVTYDRRGNIESLQRNGLYEDEGNCDIVQIDDLL